MQHTPGPWRVQRDRLGARTPEELLQYGPAQERLGIVGGPPSSVGALWVCDIPPQYRTRPTNDLTVPTRPSETEEANARLIAAAPDLLDSLKAVRARVPAGDLDLVPTDGRAPLLQLIDAAIAKAEGR